MSGGTALAVAVLLLFGNAFFVGAEFALVSARRTQIEPKAEAGSRMARTTTTREAPAPVTSRTLPRSIPPIANQGRSPATSAAYRT